MPAQDHLDSRYARPDALLWPDRPDALLDPRTGAAIGNRVKDHYEPVAAEPLPERLLDLLAELHEQEHHDNR
jgi:hypothetical protein